MSRSGRTLEWWGFTGRTEPLGEDSQQLLKYLLQRPGFLPEPFTSFWRCKDTNQILSIWTSHETWMKYPLQRCSHPPMLTRGRMRLRMFSSYVKLTQCQGGQHSHPNIPPRIIDYSLALCLGSQKYFFSAESVQMYLVKLIYLKTRNFATPSLLFASERQCMSESVQRKDFSCIWVRKWYLCISKRNI